MKALSMLQPWATLVVTGLIRIETRSWPTRHRGPLLIHASLGTTGRQITEHPLIKKYINDFNDLAFGAIIGQVTVIDVLPAKDYAKSESGKRFLTKLEKMMGDYGADRWAWILRDAVPYQEPIPAKGMLGLWDYDF